MCSTGTHRRPGALDARDAVHTDGSKREIFVSTFVTHRLASVLLDCHCDPRNHCECTSGQRSKITEMNVTLIFNVKNIMSAINYNRCKDSRFHRERLEVGSRTVVRESHIQEFTSLSQNHGRLPDKHISKHSLFFHCADTLLLTKTLKRSRSVDRGTHIQTFAQKLALILKITVGLPVEHIFRHSPFCWRRHYQDHCRLPMEHISKHSLSPSAETLKIKGQLPAVHVSKHSHKNLHTC